MNDADVQATNTDCKPTFHKNVKYFFKSDRLIDVVPGSTQMLIQGHVALGKITFCRTTIGFIAQS